jgi:hypothetical protein
MGAASRSLIPAVVVGVFAAACGAHADSSDAGIPSPTVRSISSTSHGGYRVAGIPLAVLERTAAPGSEQSIELHWRMNRDLPSRRGGTNWHVSLDRVTSAVGMHAEGKSALHCYHAELSSESPPPRSSPLYDPRPDERVEMELTVRGVHGPILASAMIVSATQAARMSSRSLRCA